MGILNISTWNQDILNIETVARFNELAMQAFRYQCVSNHVYSNYLQAIKIVPTSINSPGQIPFLPIEFFKTHTIKSGEFREEMIFTSSGTTSVNTSRHFIKSLSNYENSFRACFKARYGHPSAYRILALLPSYLEREGSSLIYMAEKLIENAAGGGFYLYDHEKLATQLMQYESQGLPTILLGVTFALLDFAAAFPIPLRNTIIMETGGMKGRRPELTRPEVHDILKTAFDSDQIHSEYGMTELLSQAYGVNGVYECPTWLRVTVRETDDPLSNAPYGRGGLNIMDLANIDSCCFIASQDLGTVNESGTFEVLGRFDQADIRGCNLMVV